MKKPRKRKKLQKKRLFFFFFTLSVLLRGFSELARTYASMDETHHVLLSHHVLLPPSSLVRQSWQAVHCLLSLEGEVLIDLFGGTKRGRPLRDCVSMRVKGNPISTPGRLPWRNQVKEQKKGLRSRRKGKKDVTKLMLSPSFSLRMCFIACAYVCVRWL